MISLSNFLRIASATSLPKTFILESIYYRSKKSYLSATQVCTLDSNKIIGYDSCLGLVELEIFTPEFLTGLPKEGKIPTDKISPLASTLMDGLQKALLRTPEFLIELGRTFFEDPSRINSVFGLIFEKGVKRFQMDGYIHLIRNISLTEYFGAGEKIIRRQLVLSAYSQTVGNITFLEFPRDEKDLIPLPNTYEAAQGVLKVIEDLDPQPNISL